MTVTQAEWFQARRQLSHWRHAVERLADLDNFAAPAAWASLEDYLGETLRKRLLESVKELQSKLRFMETLCDGKGNDVSQIQRELTRFRAQFTRVETALDFYGDAVNTRASPKLAALLRACDFLAGRSMEPVLDPLGKTVPPTLSYVDRGLGAAILRAGLRLWDGSTLSPVAAIKVTRHNLLRPTALIHEAGHQVAHQTGWNEELAQAIRQQLPDAELGEQWAGWASEITADIFAFVHTGYAAVVALHDVIAGDSGSVFHQLPGDPHPLPALRLLLNVELCRRSFGAGPWDELGAAWRALYPVTKLSPTARRFISSSVRALPELADLCLSLRLRGFAGKAITNFVDPERVRPERLFDLERAAGTSLHTSPFYLRGEGLRLLALSGLKAALAPEKSSEVAKQTEAWMSALGSLQRAAA